MFRLGILKLVSQGKYGNLPSTKSKQVKEAEEQATVLRTVCFHIRREWYRRSSKPWMLPFPRPNGAALDDEPNSPTEVAIPVPVQSTAASLLVSCHGEGFDLCEHMFAEPATDEAHLLSDSDLDDVYVYGFDVEPNGSRKAWRKLVDIEGEEIIGKEYAAHCNEPVDGVGLMVGHFLDGTEKQIPGMPFTLKRKAASKTLKRIRKKPASKSSCVSHMSEDGEEECPRAEDPERDETDGEHGEEEFPRVEDPEMDGTDGEGNEEEILPEVGNEDALVGKYVMTHGLLTSAANGHVFEVNGRREDGRFLIANLLNGPTYWVKESNLKVMTARELYPFLKRVVKIGSVNYSIRAAPRSTHTLAILVKIGEKQLGQVVAQGEGTADLARAFSLAESIMASLYDAYEEDGKEVTKKAFYEKRAELLVR